MKKQTHVADDALHELRRVAERVLGPFDSTQTTVDNWLDGVQPEARSDLADLLMVTAERIRYSREAFQLPTVSGSARDARGGLSSDQAWLPLNRKERYYTGTVLPMLVASDGFAHLHRFLALCGLEDVALNQSLNGDQDLTFFTEYGFAESVFTVEDKANWPAVAEGDTPDVVIAGPDWLVAVEAKMFHAPNRAALEKQMGRQKMLVDYWSSVRGLDAARVRHVLLLPEPLAQATEGVAYPVVTWEQVLAQYDRVGPRYWVRALAMALARHPELVSRPATGGNNADSLVLGSQIVAAHAEGWAAFDHVGRVGGLGGTAFSHDLATGAWRSTRYEVRHGALPGNRNWFSVSDFVAATATEPPTEQPT